MIILGIDPGTRFTGYAVLKRDGRQLQLLACDVLKLATCDHLPEKIHRFYTFFGALITQAHITHIALETPFLGKNAQNFLKLGYLRGIAYLLAQQHALIISEFAPREVKTAVTGYGGAEKEQVAYMMRRLFVRLPENLRADATDALAVALCGVWKAPDEKTGNI